MELGTELEVLEVRFEPLTVGKNVVYLKVRNRLASRHTLGVDLRASSPTPSGRASAWQTQYFLELAPGATVPARFPFKLQSPLADDSTIRLQLYAMASAGQFKLDQPQQRVTYRAAELERRPPSQGPPRRATGPQTELAYGLLNQLQSHLRADQYPAAARLFTKDYCDLEIMGRAWSRNDADQLARLFEGDGFRHFWDKDELLALRPEAVWAEEGTLRLEARREDQTWSFLLVPDAGQWKIDAVSGFKSPGKGWANWTERLLPRMMLRRTEHFDIHAFTNSTAHRQMDRLAARREEGLAAISRFLQREPAGRIRLVFFEDARTKYKETGHQGSGWATGQTIVEIYNAQTQMNPYHEAVHLVAAGVGSPPALFNEGLAVYLSERLRDPALADLDGDKATLDERAAQWLRQGEGIGLRELLTYTQIGPERSRPQVAYPLAGSFVKFLVERHGRDKFLEAYRALRNSPDPAIQDANAAVCQRIYGCPVAKLEEEWKECLLH